jgi:hypothetical protein
MTDLNDIFSNPVTISIKPKLYRNISELYQCRNCKATKTGIPIWVVYIEQNITGHIPYCPKCYDKLKQEMSN